MLANSAEARAQSLDLSFNPGANYSVSTVMIQADGKAPVGGYPHALSDGAGTKPRSDISLLVASTLDSAPSVTTHPSNQAVATGQTATFTAAASGTPTPTVQWQVRLNVSSPWANINGAIATTYAFVAAAADNGQQYRAVFSNPLGGVATNAATLAMLVVPSVTSQPVDLTAFAGAPAAMAAAASGNPTPTVQWQVSTNGGTTWANISGATATALRFTAKLSDSGNKYWAVFTNNAGTVTTNAVTLTVQTPTPGMITTVAGIGGYGFSGDGGPATDAELRDPFGITVDAVGNLYITDHGNSRVRKVSAASGIITTVAGGGAGGDGGPATSASLGTPWGMAVNAAGDLYIGNSENHRIRKVTEATNLISTVAGTGAADFFGDGGLAVAAALNTPTGIAVDATGNLYIADYSNNRIRKVTAATGMISTVAGTGIGAFGGDGGPATAAKIHNPTGLAIDTSGNLYIADRGNFRIRKVASSTGVITTVAGTSTEGFSGDGGPATAAKLNYATDVAVDAGGNLYIMDTGNQRVRKVMAATGVIVTVAGNGNGGYGGDGGLATVANLASPWDVEVDAAGNLYIVDRSNSRIRMVMPIAPPAVASIAPAVGSTLGATVVIITGTGFAAGARVAMGGVDATAVSVVNSTTITATTSPHTKSVVDVVVTNTDAQQSTLVGGFTYINTPVLSWANPASIAYGTPLSGVQLNATASSGGAPVGGTFVYTPSVGAVLPPGTGRTLATTFTPTDASNYSTATKSVTIDVTNPNGAPTFTDDPLGAASTEVKAVHFTELRQAIDTLRARFSLGAIVWTDATIVAGVTPVKVNHLTELRAALDAVYAAAARTAPIYTHAVITGGATVITVVDIAELRAAILAVW